ncbi:MAG: late competence development ComFB family protein [Clostridium sp.]|nr:late competence development ComFB family protein [Clostridium sp.]MDY3827384.1 late competence development ComFB family protein [Clostridium sp.]
MENVVNYMEIWVEQFMDDILKDRPEVCTCEKCRQDIFALSLNNLQPFYVTTTKGEILAKYNVRYSQFETDILLAITNAINLVTSNPHHSEED